MYEKMTHQEDYKSFMENKEIPTHCRGTSFGDDRLDTVQTSENLGSMEGPTGRDPLQSLLYNKSHYQRQFNKLISNNKIDTRPPEIIYQSNKIQRQYQSTRNALATKKKRSVSRPQSASFMSSKSVILSPGAKKRINS
jgi:hypothetical protein